MSADDERRPLGGDYRGFQAYADDTPRYVEDERDWAAQPSTGSRAGATRWADDDDLRLAYGAPPRPPPPRARISRPVALTGMALAACAVALLAWSLGPHATTRGAAADAADDDSTPLSGPQLRITSAPPPAAPVYPAAPLSLLPTVPAQAANAAPAPAPIVAPPVVAPQAVAPQAVAPPAPEPRAATGLAAPAGAQAPLAPPPEPRPPVHAQAEPRAQAAAACAYARTGADLLVCNDPDLAAADRQVIRAYRAALAAGAPEAALSREQANWLAAREDAAHRSRREVEDLYAQRLRDLADWRDEAQDRDDR